MSAAGIALSSAASSSRIVGDFPPSSSVTRFIVAAPSRMMLSPTPTEPVNEIFATSGLRTSSAPTILPRPVTTFKRPFGSSASCRRLYQHPRLQRAHFAGLDHDRTTRGDGRGELEAHEQRVRIPSRDQAGDADRLQGHRRLVPTRVSHGICLECLFGG